MLSKRCKQTSYRIPEICIKYRYCRSYLDFVLNDLN